jgi:hypothetical protein
MSLCKWQGGACERETDHASGLCSQHRSEVPIVGTGGLPKDTARLGQFLKNLETCVGVTIWQGHPAYVYQGTTITLEPCMYEASFLQDALDSGKAEKRSLTIHQAYKLSHTIEIVALKKKT